MHFNIDDTVLCRTAETSSRAICSSGSALRCTAKRGQAGFRLSTGLPTLALLAVSAALLHPGRASGQDFSSSTTHTAPNPETAQREAVNAALEAGQYPKALELLAPLVKTHPDDPELLLLQASTEDALEQNEPAIRDYRAVIALNPALVTPHVALGLLLARTGHPAEARTELVKATESAPSQAQAPGSAPAIAPDAGLRARAYRALARLDAQDRPAAARDELLAALKLSPETPDDTLLAAELAAGAGSGTGPAEAAYRRVLAQRPDDPDATAGLAHLLTQQKKPAEAEPLLRHALLQHPGDPALTLELAGLLRSSGRATEALPLVASLHEKAPQDRQLTLLTANLMAQTGDFASAEPLYEALLHSTPAGQQPDPTLLDSAADALMHLQRPGEAEALLTQATSLPASAWPSPAALGEAAGRLAFSASENNDPEACLRALQLRATVLPPSPVTLFLRAISEDKLHHPKEARKAYRDFLAADNGSLPDQEFEARHRLVALDHTR